MEAKARSKPADAKTWKPKKLSYDERKANLKVTTDLFLRCTAAISIVAFRPTQAVSTHVLQRCPSVVASLADVICRVC